MSTESMKSSSNDLNSVQNETSEGETKDYSLLSEDGINPSVDLSNFVCTICYKKLGSKHALEQHFVAHTGVKPYSCETCNKRFTQKSSLQTHFLIHEGKKPHACDICNKSFTDKSTLRKHRLIHSGEKPHVCDICQKGFVQKSTLLKHHSVHTGDKPHACSVCDKRFSQKSTLKTHSLIHLRKTTFPCSLCNRKFTSKYHQYNHEQTHKEEYKYDCSKVFASKQCVEQYLKTHNQSKLHICKKCNSEFKSENRMLCHLRACESDLSLFLCSTCNEEYMDIKSFQDHISMHSVDLVRISNKDSKHQHLKPKRILNNKKLPHQKIIYQDYLKNDVNVSSVQENVECDICLELFKNNQDYEKHKELHSTIPIEEVSHSLTCDICSKSFNSKRSMAKHFRTHTLDKLKVCKDCGDSFVEDFDFEIHCMMQHR